MGPGEPSTCVGVGGEDELAGGVKVNLLGSDRKKRDRYDADAGRREAAGEEGAEEQSTRREVISRSSASWGRGRGSDGGGEESPHDVIDMA